MEQPLYQLVALEHEPQDLGSSPPPGTQAMQAIQDLPPTPVPGEPPAQPLPLATKQQLQLRLTDTSSASNPTTSAIADAIAEPEPYGTVSEQDDMAEVLESKVLHSCENVHAWLLCLGQALNLNNAVSSIWVQNNIINIYIYIVLFQQIGV